MTGRSGFKTAAIGYGMVIVFLILGLFFTGNYGMYQLSPLAGELMAKYNLGTQEYSSIFSAALIPGVFLSLIAGVLCDKFGVTRMITLSVVISTIAIVGRVFAESYVPLFIFSALAGTASTFVNSNIAKFLGPWFSPEALSSKIGIAMSGGTIAAIVGVSTTAFFSGIKPAFTFSAALAVIFLILWFILIREPETPKGLNGEQPEPLEQVSVAEGLKVALSNIKVWLVGFALMFVLLSMVAVSGFLPLALQASHGMDVASASFVTSVFLVGTLVGTLTGPAIAQKLQRDKLFTVVCATIAALGVAFAWLAPQGLPMLVLMFITGYCIAAMMPIFISMPYKIVGPTYAGTAGGVVSTLQTFGPVFFPAYVLAPLAGDNFGLILQLAGGLILITIICAILLPDFSKASRS